MARVRTALTSPRTRTVVAAVSLASALTLSLSSCGKADMTKQTSPFAAAGGSRSVTLSFGSWVGANANVGVAKYLLEHELGYHVDTTQVDEIPAWDALSQGRIDAILEDWGHPEQEKQYIDEKKTVTDGGTNGVTGHIGWFVPTYWAKAHPDVLDWHNLDKYAGELKTSESGGKGQLLDGSPAYVTNDKALVKNLHLDYHVVFAGSEAAQITQIQQYAKQKKPFLTYWYEPQWLFKQVPMTEVKLPKYTDACAKKGEKDPQSIDCAYPKTPVKKYFNAQFAKGNSDAAKFLKKFRWSNDDQNEVSELIASKGLTPDEAAEKWVHAHPEVWKKWLP
ncbi:ABC transporter substrate-binding protein [Streptomyces sp. NPDC059740]|uniref:ABC transporter substrate-binding protein n=1 Tax=Streptomyces sp. NPDC059740 TaxID=3346926 RepID=UPI00364956AD